MSRRGGHTPVFGVLGACGASFAGLVGYCTAGVWGLLAALAGVAVLVWLIGAELDASHRRQTRADTELVHHYASLPAPRDRRQR